MYAASHMEEATNFWRFDCHAMGLCRQNATKLDFERRVSRQDTYSESEYAKRDWDGIGFVYVMPWVGV